METKIDRRIIKSRTVIKATFLELLLTEGFDQITIKDIAEGADISRKTFYLHYLDKYDLLDKIVKEHIEALRISCLAYGDQGYEASSLVWFAYFEEHKVFFKSLFESESTVTFRKELEVYLMEELVSELKEEDQIQKEVTLRFLSSAIVGVISGFLLDQIDATFEEIALQTAKLIESNLK